LSLSLANSSGKLNIIHTEWSFAMKRMNLSKILGAAIFIVMGGPVVAASTLAQSQGSYGPGNGNGMGSGMMGGGYGGGWMGGGYGGIWLPVLLLLVIVVAGLVAWTVAQKRR
jgi:uncharacterized membrane protein